MHHRPARTSPATAAKRAGCWLCSGLHALNTNPAAADPGRRLFTRWLGGAALVGSGVQALAQEPVAEGVRGDVGRTSRFAKLMPAEQVEAAAGQQYQQMLRNASQQRALAPIEHPQRQRLNYIAQRIIPFTPPWNGRASRWQWEVNLLGSDEINAFCMPGGKIAFYLGILRRLQLNDHEVAAIMGHEAAHALREHARERMGKDFATQTGVNLLSGLLGLGGTGDTLLRIGGQLLSLKFSREDETEADLVGLDLAARAGYDPAAGVSLWQKMLEASKGAPPKFLSTHPPGQTRIRDIQGKLAKVAPLFERAAKPDRRFAPPKAEAAAAPRWDAAPRCTRSPLRRQRAQQHDAAAPDLDITPAFEIFHDAADHLARAAEPAAEFLVRGSRVEHPRTGRPRRRQHRFQYRLEPAVDVVEGDQLEVLGRQPCAPDDLGQQLEGKRRIGVQMAFERGAGDDDDPARFGGLDAGRALTAVQTHLAEVFARPVAAVGNFTPVRPRAVGPQAAGDDDKQGVATVTLADQQRAAAQAAQFAPVGQRPQRVRAGQGGDQRFGVRATAGRGQAGATGRG
jgi:Zn-dependent protease with chaperone function